MYGHLPPIILASQSPRRAQLLQEMGIVFTVHPSMVPEEQIAASYPLPEQAEQLARAKAIAAQIRLQGQEKNSLLLAADTVVLLGGRRLDKPSNVDAARSMLRSLSGQEHRVVTGVALRQAERMLSFSELTVVHFAPLRSAEIEHYIRSCHPFDKAGGYGIQDWLGLACIDRIEGSYTNVMGLPTQAVHQALITWGEHEAS